MFKSIFPRPEGGIAAGIGTALAVFLIYNSQLPSSADLRIGPAHEQNAEASRKGAAVESAALIGIVFLLTRDLNAFIISGVALGGIDYLAKHHNGINGASGQWDSPSASVSEMATVHPMPQYGDAESMSG